MIDRGKRSILGVDVDVVDYEGAVEKIIAAARARRPFGVSALAVHGVMTGALDPEHLYRLNRLDLVTPDGQPVRWALRWLHGEKLPARVSGPELMELVCESAAENGLPVYLYGSRPEVLDKLRSNLLHRYSRLRIAGAEPSRFRTLSADEDAELDARIRNSGARIVFVGLGCPRQEVFVFEHAEALGMPALAVGAAFDFHAGTVTRAPRWMRSAGLEWLFRLLQDPKRLWRRYLVLNTRFVLMLTVQLAGGAKQRNEAPPMGHARYG